MGLYSDERQGGTHMTDRSSDARTRAAVIGAGRMGHGIALEAARGGFSVAIYDTQPDRAEVAIAEAAADANDLVEAGCIEASDIPAIVDRLTAATDLGECRRPMSRSCSRL